MISIPAGYTAYFMGSAATLEEIGTLAPLEESKPEGTLMLMQLNFEESPTVEQLADLNSQLSGAGVPPWPGYTQVAYLDTAQPSMYICWVKGIAWMSVIIGMLVLFLLPALLGAFVWWLLPESLKNMINMMVMMLVVVLMMKVMTPMLEEKKK